MQPFDRLRKVRALCRSCLTLVALAMVSAQATAQGVTGVVSDQETRLPLAGALITIRDSVQRVAGRVLSDSSGRFAVRVLPGRYQLEVEHIGYRKTTRPVASPNTGFTTVDFQVEPAPIALDQIQVDARSHCRQASDPQTARLWYFAKTALGSSAVTTGARMLRVRTYTRDRDLSLRVVGDERMEFATMRGLRAFRAASVDSLLTHGFVQRRPQGDYFYGPDVEVLLSDQFVDVHCFRVTRNPSRTGLVGLEFWPGERGPARGIRGAMWLAEETGVLQFVEYSYTGLAADVDPRLAGGRVDFFPADAGWLVRSWYIRMPRYAEVSTAGRLRSTMVGARETGAEILSYDALTGDSSIANGSISGMVFDSVRREPLAHATVYLSGTSYSTQTSTAGEFLFDAVPAGDYYVSFDHPVLAELPLFVTLVPVHVAADQTAHAELAVPSESGLLQQMCAAEQMAEAGARLGMTVPRLGAVTGRVRRGSSAVEQARVEVRWDPRMLPRRAPNREVTNQWAETDAHGSYLLCGVPTGVDVNMIVTVSAKIVARKHVRASARRVARIDFELP